MGRSVCSLRTKAAQLTRYGKDKKVEPVKRMKGGKPTIQNMINQALKSLNQQTGTKEEIIEKIEDLFAEYLTNDEIIDKKDCR